MNAVASGEGASVQSYRAMGHPGDYSGSLTEATGADVVLPSSPPFPHARRTGPAFPGIMASWRFHQSHRVSKGLLREPSLTPRWIVSKYARASTSADPSSRSPSCILTHQLYTQRVLAVYFVGVDVALMSQYIYYSSKHPIPSLPPLSESYPHAQAPEGHHQHHHSHSRRPHKRRRRSGATSGSRTKSTSAGGDDPMTRSWMSEASTTTDSPTSSRQNTTAFSSRDVSRQPSRQPSAHFTWSTTSGSAASTEPPSPTLPERGRTLTRPPRPSVPVLETIRGSPASGSPVPGLHHVNFRGEVETPGEESRPSRHRPTSSTSRSRPPPPSRRATSSMLFLSVGLLVTFSKWSGGMGMQERDLGGVAWAAGAVGSAVEPESRSGVWRELRHPSFFRYTDAESAAPSLPSRHDKRQTFPIAVSSPSPSYTAVDAQADQSTDDEPHWHDKDGEPHRYPKRDWERFIGRASAWMCTTLYLTSRLPQIWQNVSLPQCAAGRSLS